MPPLMRFPAPALPQLFSPGLDMESLAAANSPYRQPAPPPQLPMLQIPGRHQEPLWYDPDDDKQAGPSCPHKSRWPACGDHVSAEKRLAAFTDDEVEQISQDIGLIVRREFDSWVEACW